MNTSQKGNLALSKVLSRLTEKEYAVFLPFGDGTSCDLIAEKDNKLIRMQVKLGRLREGTVLFNCYSTTRSYAKTLYTDKIDAFGIYCTDTDEVYLVPFAESTTTVVTLRVSPSKRKCKRTKFATDYII